MNATLAPPGLLQPKLRHAIRHGLSTRPLSLPVECLYDPLGSALFDAITRLPEYGLSRAERRLLDRHRHVLAEWLPAPLSAVELGSGTGATTAILLEALARRGPVAYHPIDISAAALADCKRRVEGIKGIDVRPFEGTHRDGLASVSQGRAPGSSLLVLFLGSSIGNLERDDVRPFLTELRSFLRPGDALLLGADLVKPEALLLAAYDDPLGLTAAFNRNALSRVNRELDADFDPRAFRHRAIYDPCARRVEMHLVSEEPQCVEIGALGMRLTLAPGETIHTESSHKFQHGELAAIGRCCGFVSVVEWDDAEWPFSVTLLVAD
jgi:L-histidine N-alpha-methyltransferase